MPIDSIYYDSILLIGFVGSPGEPGPIGYPGEKGASIIVSHRFHTYLVVIYLHTCLK